MTFLYILTLTQLLVFKISIEEAKVYDLNGRLILTEYITKKLDVSCLKKGYYLIKLSDGSNELIHKMIKN